MAIKFRKERVDEYTVRHYLDEGTKYLPPLYVEGRTGSYYFYEAETNDYLPILAKYEYIRTLKDAKVFLENYDEIEEASRTAAEAEEAARIAEWEADKAAKAKATEDYKVPYIGPKADFKVGETIAVRFPALNKNNTIGENLIAMAEKAYDERGKVEKVIDLSTEKFDWFMSNLMAYREESGVDIGNGGSASDAEFKNDDIMKILNDPEDRAVWNATYYSFVTVVRAPLRKPIVVNAEGYDYARYVGMIIN